MNAYVADSFNLVMREWATVIGKDLVGWPVAFALWGLVHSDSVFDLWTV